MALDDLIDARHAWVDDAATELAERIAGRPVRQAATRGTSRKAGGDVTFAWLNVLRLQYFLVKLLRVVALADVQGWSHSGNTIQLHVEPVRDGVYVDLFRSLCRTHGFNLSVHESATAAATAPTQPTPSNSVARQTAGMVSSWLDRLRHESVETPRIVFVGSQAVLGEVCAESLRRGHRAWWLFDRFSLSAWKQWSAAGAGQLTCNSNRGRHAGLDLHAQSWPWYAHGVDLTPAVHRWLREQAAARAANTGAANTRAANTGAARQTRLIERIDRHFARLRPAHVVLDEDATPMARAAVAMAHRHGATTSVVQHGAPFVRFGFVPSIADQTFVWGESSKKQLVDWGAGAETIHVTGSPKHDRHPKRRPVRGDEASPAPDRREILLLATVPPRDDRPDAVSFHLTTATHERMLRAAFAVVARLDDYELVVRPHPRAPETSIFTRLAAETPGLRYRIEREGTLEDRVARAAMVLSCASSAGVDAVRLGARVVQLMPEGSVDALVAQHWGMVGTARWLDELAPLVDEALRAGRTAANKDNAAVVTNSVFANRAEPAACRIVDQLVGEEDERMTIRVDEAHANITRNRDGRRPGHRPERRAA